MHLYMNYFSSIDILSTFSTVINSIFFIKREYLNKTPYTENGA